jgi:hypothetical protein
VPVTNPTAQSLLVASRNVTETQEDTEVCLIFLL